MNIDTIEVITILNSANWKTQMFLDAMTAQCRLMNGNKQKSKVNNNQAEQTLRETIEYELRYGNKLLVSIYSEILERWCNVR